MFGCFRIEDKCDDDNEAGLKEGREIEMSNYSAFHIRDARSPFALYLLTINCSKISGRCAKLLSMTLCAIKGRGLVNAKATAFNVL